MRKLALSTIAAMAMACGGDDNGGTGPSDDTINIAGTWEYVVQVSNSGLAVTCTMGGDLVVSQTNDQFNGESVNSAAQCEGPGGTFTDSADGPITGGSISGSTVTYNDGFCAYTGTASGNPVNRVAGSVSCNVAVSGQNVPMTGTWQISR